MINNKPDEKETPDNPKKIVYLLGAGATQAEIQYQSRGGSITQLLMSGEDGVSARVVSRARKSSVVRKFLTPAPDRQIDIEKFISLLEGSGIEKSIDAAHILSKYYYEVIMETLHNEGIIANPELAKLLLEMHEDPLFKRKEKLQGVISLNHDNILQVAAQNVYSGINPGIEFISTSLIEKPKAPLVLNLHGSFSWRRGIPIEILELSGTEEYQHDVLWIPPTIQKDVREYPYNKIYSLAYEILANCDTVRVIGFALKQNDWNVIKLLFNSQYLQHHLSGVSFKIELIVPHDTVETIKNECSYLKNLIDMEDLREGREFEDLKDLDDGNKRIFVDNNWFLFWLKTKINHHIRQGEVQATLGETVLEAI